MTRAGDGLLQRIQIVLVDMPRMLRDMIEEAVAAQPDMRVVETVPERSALLEATRRTRPEFVIFGIDDDEDDFPPGCLEVLEEQPRTRILGIQAAAGLAYLYELRPERTRIGEVAPEDVVAAIRSAAAQRSG
jgi:DNA-binding NarL/FixJ family response regulator